MKKVVKLIGTLGCVLLLCGCGSKKMSCTMDTDDEVMKIGRASCRERV